MPFKKTIFKICLIALFFNNTSLAQDSTLYNINIYNGLPSNHAYCMLSDKYGYLWIGTDEGVVKYNGYSFNIFNESTGLPDHDVWDFFEDSKGRIWLSRISKEKAEETCYCNGGISKKAYPLRCILQQVQGYLSRRIEPNYADEMR